MVFNQKDKSMLQQFIAVLTNMGIYPDKKDICRELLNKLDGTEVSDLTKFVLDNLPADYMSKLADYRTVVVQKSDVAIVTSNKFKITSGRSNSSFCMLLHGQPGTGKTTLASKIKNVLFCDAENGSLKLDCNRVSVSNFQAVVDVVDWFFSSDCSYSALCLDTINAIEKMCHDHTCAQNNWDNLEKAGYGKGFSIANLEMNKLIMKIRNLSIAQKKSVIFLGHSKIKSCPNPDGEDFEHHCIGLHKDLNSFIYGQMDHVLFIYYKMNLVAADDKDKDSKLIAKGQGILQINTGGTPNVVSKNRCNPPLSRVINVPALNATEEQISSFWRPFY